ncbi:14056_t:CDS:2, partial [Entrophospora sp. SA101]
LWQDGILSLVSIGPSFLHLFDCIVAGVHVATFILSHERAKLVDLCQSSGNGLTPYASSPDDGNDVDNDEYDLLSNNNLFL